MTFSNQSNRVSAVGSGAVSQAVPFSFPISATSDLTVFQRVTASGVESTLVETTNYTVAISGDAGGTVTTVTAIAVTAEIHVVRDTPNTQGLKLTQGGAFNGPNVEDALDKGVKLGIENKDVLTRTMRIPQTDATSINMEMPSSIDRADKFLTFDSDGEPAVTEEKTTGTAVISAFGETLIDDASAAAARTTLGSVIGTDVQAWDDDLDDIAALAKTDGNIMVGDGTDWVVESEATARTSLGVPDLLDEDDMLSDSAVAAPSQQSVAAFVYSIVSYDGDVLTYDGDVVTYV